MPIQEEYPGQTKDMLERLYLSAALRTFWCPTGKIGERGWGEERLDLPSQAIAPMT